MNAFLDKLKGTFTRDNMKKTFTGNGAMKAYSSLFCIACGLLIGFILMVILSPQNALFDFGVLITGGIPYYGAWGFGNLLANFAPLLCCGVGVIFAYKTGIFNIGAAGQYTLGAFGALLFAIKLDANWAVCIIMAMIFGAIWATIPALLKVFCNVNEVISGIMLNWIGLFFVNYSLQTYLSDMLNSGNSYKTWSLFPDLANDYAGHPNGLIPGFGDGAKQLFGNSFTIAFIIAIIIAIIAFVVMERTTFGYQLKASGYNRHATKYAGMNAKKNTILTMAISGAIIGLGASLFYLAGIEEWSGTVSSSLPQLPWNGIIIAFIAQMNPVGGIFASGFLALITTGATATTQSVFPKEIGDLITSVIVYLSGLTAITMKIIPWIKEKIKRKKDKGAELPLPVEANKGGK